MADIRVDQGVILALCNPLLDISAEVPPEFLEKYELDNKYV